METRSNKKYTVPPDVPSRARTQARRSNERRIKADRSQERARVSSGLREPPAGPAGAASSPDPVRGSDTHVTQSWTDSKRAAPAPAPVRHLRPPDRHRRRFSHRLSRPGPPGPNLRGDRRTESCRRRRRRGPHDVIHPPRKLEPQLIARIRCGPFKVKKRGVDVTCLCILF